MTAVMLYCARCGAVGNPRWLVRVSEYPFQAYGTRMLRAAPLMSAMAATCSAATGPAPPMSETDANASSAIPNALGAAAAARARIVDADHVVSAAEELRA